MAKGNETLFFVEGNPKFEYADAALLGVAFDKNAAFGKGAADAPEAIIKASHQIDIEQPLTGKLLETAIHNYGVIKPKNVVEMVKGIEGKAKACIAAKKTFILLGGDHSVVNGLLDAVPSDCTFVNFDAHLDLREEWQGKKQSHFAVSRRIFDKGFEQVWIGIRDTINEEEIDFVTNQVLGNRIFYCPTMPEAFYKKESFPEWIYKKNMLFDKKIGVKQTREIVEKIKTDKVWINIDIDCLDPSQGIETGVPLPFGMTLDAMNEIIYEVSQKKHILGFNICELIPDKHGKGQAIAASLCFNILNWV